MSGSLCKKLIKGNRGPIKTILIGDRIVDTTDFQAPWDSDPRKDSGGWSKSKVVLKRKANAKMRKRATNFILEIFILFELNHRLLSVINHLRVEIVSLSSIYGLFCQLNYFMTPFPRKFSVSLRQTRFFIAANLIFPQASLTRCYNFFWKPCENTLVNVLNERF